MTDWPRGPTRWWEGGVLHISVPFTWNLPVLLAEFLQGDLWRDSIVVGGPALQLMPEYFQDLEFVTVGRHAPGVLQRVNPEATRTTIGCPRSCGFCAVSTIEGKFHELSSWPNLPIISDNNLLAAGETHLNEVFSRLSTHLEPDFNGGLDVRLLNEWHAKRLSELVRPKIRLACDSMAGLPTWHKAVELLLSAGIPKRQIYTYALIGWQDTPSDAWKRCEIIRKQTKYTCPMWFHELDAMKQNQVTERQQQLGWTNQERLRIMGFYYKHRGKVPDQNL